MEVDALSTDSIFNRISFGTNFKTLEKGTPMLQVTDELLKEMTETIVRGVNPSKIILFGSYAKGTARPDSDQPIPTVIVSN